MATISSVYSVRTATMADAHFLRGKLRQSDYDEVMAASGKNLDDVLPTVLDVYCEKAWVGCIRNVPALIFGVSAPSSLSFIGSPWLLATKEMDRAGVAVAHKSRYYVQEMKKLFDRLEGFTDARHKVSHRWLKWCGFTLDEPIPYGVENRPFHRFWMG